MKSNQVKLVILGSTDRQLEDLLRTDGASVTSQPIEALAALAHPSGGAPDAIVVDLRDAPEIPPALPSFKRHNPQTGVVIVAATLDPALMLDAMRAGVNEWIAEPVNAGALVEAVQRVMVNRAAKSAIGKVFGFVGAKGGVGTTTVAVNVATALAALAPRGTLLVDLHLAHGDASLFLGVESKFTVADALENIHRLDEAFLRGLVTHTKIGLDLLPSSDRTLTHQPEARHVRELVDFAAQYYQYVVLDVPRDDMTMLDSLELASALIVVANQELATVRRASNLLMALRQRYGRERVSVVMSRFDAAAEIRREDVERVTGSAVRYLIPSDYRIALDGLNKGQPVVVENHNRLAASFVGMARGLAGLERQKTPSAKSGIFSLLGRR